ncbi:Crp/Fnr family transcriptional regulator [Niameybacter massiliensis]|uniref:Crp/Fnr family transcriptional regulator n=1 Tax=Holtiella tumoricola TaxID=3018743 RepID=A0AA42DQ00_9FIRM|nr:Crp/Fnr family transcriptional regulator [Holtiella tumoricola]MDA3733028.1 Crp/Fnr family transcriptional regulator [Holtiella tumoricola]
MISQEDQSFLVQHLSFWEHLTPSQQTLLFEHTHLVHFSAGQTLHSGDKDCIGIILIKNGSLRTYMLSEKGKDITLYRLFGGDLCTLSASCILNHITFDVHIDAEEDTEALLIHTSIFSQLIKENIYVENFSNKTTVERFSDVMWAMEQMLFMSFDERLALFLLDESAKCGCPTLKFTHEQIAKYIGSAREVVSRMLKYFEQEGLVKLSRGGVTITDKAALKQRFFTH